MIFRQVTAFYAGELREPWVNAYIRIFIKREQGPNSEFGTILRLVTINTQEDKGRIDQRTC